MEEEEPNKGKRGREISSLLSRHREYKQHAQRARKKKVDSESQSFI